jgi:hypothetical protein
MPSYTNLILRTLTSPYGDITRGGVLSWNDVDQNFLYLKGESIYGAESSGGTITLKKYNGNDISFSGGSIPTIDVYVTGGTFNLGVASFTNNTGGTFSVTGFASTDTFVTGFTYSNNNLTLLRNQGLSDLNVIIDIMSGLTINGDLIVTGNTILQSLSATTLNISNTPTLNPSPTDILVRNSSTGDVEYVPVSAITPDTNTFVTGYTYDDLNTFTITQNNGTTFNTTINYVSGLTINGNFNVTGDTILNTLTANTVSATTYYNLPLDVYVTGGTYSDGTTTFTNNSGGTFDISGFTIPFSGGSGNCITDLYVTNVHGCSPITIHDSIQTVGSSATGTTSFAFGINVSAEGNYSHAEGEETIAIGDTSHAEGNNTTSIGYGSHAEGGGTTSEGIRSHAEGGFTTSIGNYSHAEGYETITGWRGFTVSNILAGTVTITGYGDLSGSFGSGILYDENSVQTPYSATTWNSPNFEIYLTDSPIYFASFVADINKLYESLADNLLGRNSHTEGYGTKAIGISSHAEGNNTRAYGSNSHSEGLDTKAIGFNSHAEGKETTSIGEWSHAEGGSTTAIGIRSHSEGDTTTSIGNTSHAEGGLTISFGDYSHSEGYQTTSIGIGSHTEGLGTISNGNYQHVQGQYNLTASTDSAFIIGNGIDDNNRSNLVYAAGNEFNIYGDLTVTGNTTINTLSATTFYGNGCNLDYVNYVPNVIKVSMTGGCVDFTSIKDAVDSITGSSSTNRYVIEVGPGEYYENEIDLTSKPYVSIIGSNIQTTEVLPNTSSQHIFKIGINTEISFLRISNAGSGYAGIYCYDIGDYAQAHKLSFYNCDINIWVESNTQDTKFYGEYIDFNGEYSYGIKVIGNNGKISFANMENYYNYPTGSGVTICNYGQGSGSTINIFVGDNLSNGVSGTTAFLIEDATFLNISSINVDGFTYGIRNPNIGEPVRFDIDNISLINGVSDLSVERLGTFGTIGGSSSHSKVYSISENVYWSFLDIDDGELEITRKASVTFQDGTHTDFTTLIFKGGTMGLIEGGNITIVSGLTINVDSGYGYLEKYPDINVIKRIDWVSNDLTLTSGSTSYIYYNQNDILSSSGSRPDSVNNIILGRVVTNSTTIEFIDLSPLNASHTSNRYGSLFRNALGPIYSSGSIVTENVTPFNLDVTAGEYYYSTNKYVPSGGTQISFTQYYRDGLGGWITSATTSVSNTYFDGNGSLSGLTASAFTKHTLYVVGDDINEKYFLVLGQNEYPTLIQTEDALLPTPPTFFDGSVTQIANIYVQQGTTGVTQVEDIRPVIGFKAGGVNASSLHANLLGLSSDDHTQYLLVNGGRSMSGDLNMDNNNIISAGTINGVTITSHSTRHKYGGLDEVGTTIPAANAIPYANVGGKLDDWITTATTTNLGLVKMSSTPLDASNPTAVSESDLRFLKSFTGVSYSNNVFTFSNVSGETTSSTINSVTGLTINGNLTVTGNSTLNIVSANTISATTYQNLPVTADTYTTGFTYSSNTLTIKQNQNRPDINVVVNTMTGLTVNGTLSATTVYSNGVGIKTTTPTFDLEVNGTFGAISKSFVIKHPTQEGKKLVYGAIEGPEFGVYVRGKVNGNIIELPEEWVGLVDESTITVQLTGDGLLKLLYVKEIKNNMVHISNMIPFITPTGYYTVYGERKDIDKLKTII